MIYRANRGRKILLITFSDDLWAQNIVSEAMFVRKSEDA